MPGFIIDAISNDISLLKFKLAKADGYAQRSQLQAQIKDKEEYMSRCLDEDYEQINNWD